MSKTDVVKLGTQVQRLSQREEAGAAGEAISQKEFGSLVAQYQRLSAKDQAQLAKAFPDISPTLLNALASGSPDDYNAYASRSSAGVQGFAAAQAADTAPSMAEVLAGNAVFKLGQSGAGIVDLQKRLNAAGYQPPLVADGDFGSGTLAAVKWFQAQNGLDADGVVGALTMSPLSQVPIDEPTPPVPANYSDWTLEMREQRIWDIIASSADPTQGLHNRETAEDLINLLGSAPDSQKVALAQWFANTNLEGTDMSLAQYIDGILAKEQPDLWRVFSWFEFTYYDGLPDWPVEWPYDPGCGWYPCPPWWYYEPPFGSWIPYWQWRHHDLPWGVHFPPVWIQHRPWYDHFHHAGGWDHDHHHEPPPHHNPNPHPVPGPRPGPHPGPHPGPTPEIGRAHV
jgi:peptidoglycan hydrolase-like protein with peptidoglycan-binding domain